MEERFASADYYGSLGLSPSADDAEIKSAFRRLALQHHPDKAKYNKEEAKRRFQEVAEAYEVLSDADLRAHYNRVRQRAEGSSRTSERRPPKKSMSVREMRLAAVRADLDRERAERDRESEERSRHEKEQYLQLKSKIRSKLNVSTSFEGADDATWDSWWVKQVRAKWLDEAWEEHLPGVGTKGLHEVVLRDVMQDMQQEEAERNRRLSSKEDTEEVQMLRRSYTTPMPKRKSSSIELREDSARETPKNATAMKPYTCRVDPGDLRTLREMGFQDGHIMHALSCGMSVSEAADWIHKNFA